MKKLLNKIKHLNKKLVLMYVSIFAFLATTVAAFAWFSGNIEKDGINITTGQILVEANGYNYDSEAKTLTMTTNNIGSASASLVSTDLFQYGNTCDTFFMVEKQDGSIDVDYYLTLQLENNDYEIPSASLTDENELTYIGGYWFKLEKITTEVISATNIIDSSFDTTTLSANEILLMNYAETVKNTTNSGIQHPLSMIDQYPTRDSLDSTTTVHFYRLTCGFTSYSSLYTSTTIRLRARIDFAQKGALTNAEIEANSTWYVSNLDDFYTFLAGYKAGDTVKIQGNVTYPGDLTFTKPINMYVNSATLTILGNFIYDFAFVEQYFINTSSAGKILVSSSGASAGNLELKTPNSEIHLIGKGKASGSGDIFIRGNMYVNASYGSETTSGGLYISGFNIYETTIDGKIPTTGLKLKDFYFEGKSKIEISSNSKVNEIITRVSESETLSAAKYIKIVNYGIVKKIRLTSMIHDSSIVDVPQIYIDNYGEYGTETDNKIELPQWSMPYFVNGVKSDGGNTRIIQEEESSILSTKLATTSSANTNPFQDVHIEVKRVSQFVIDVDGDNKNIIINYADNEDGTTNTIQSILYDYYFKDLGYDDTTKATLLNNKLTDYKKLTIISYQRKEFTISDMNIVKKCTNLEYLDTSRAYYTTIGWSYINFSNMSKLSSLYLSESLTAIANTAFRSDYNLLEITIPASVTTLLSSSSDCFYDTGIQYIHIKNPEIAKSIIYISKYYFVDESILASLRSTFSSYPHRILPEATWNEDHTVFYRQIDDGYYELVLETGVLEYDSNDLTLIDRVEIDSSTNGVLSSIGDYAFYNYNFQTNLNTKIKFGDNVKYLGMSNFYNKGSFTLMNLNNITEVGSTCFYNDTFTTLYANNVLLANSSAFESATINNQTFNKLITANSNCFSKATLPDTYTFPELLFVGSSCFNGTKNVKKLMCEKLTQCIVQSFAYMPSLEVLYCPMLCEGGNFESTDYSIRDNPKLYELYIGYIYKSDCYILYGNTNLRYLYICGTSLDSSKTCNNIVYIKQSSIQQVFCNENLYSSVINKMTSANSNYYLDPKTVVSVSCDAKDLLKYGSYHGENNEYSNDLGMYIIEPKGSQSILLSYEPRVIQSTTDQLIDYTVPNLFTIDSTTYTIVKVGDLAYSKTSITVDKLIVPNTITEVGNYSLTSEQGNLKTANQLIASSLVSAGAYSFYQGSFSLLDLPVIKTAGKACFYGCVLPSYISIPSLITIGESCFSSCNTIKELRLENLETLGISSLSYLSNVETIYCPNLHYFPYGNTYNNGFADNPYLYELYIGVAYSNGYYGNIYNNSRLRFLYVCGTSADKSKQETIGARVMIHNCNSLTAIFCNENIVSYFNSYMNTYNGKVYSIKCDAKDLVKSGSYKGDNNEFTLEHGLYILEPNGVNAKIVSYSSQTINSTTHNTNKYIIPSSLQVDSTNYTITELGDYSYYGTAININEIEISSSITKIGSYAFALSNTKTFNKITAPGLIRAESYAFSGATIDEIDAINFTTASNYCFSNCVFPNEFSISSLVTIEQNCFYNCDSVRKLSLENLSIINHESISYCDALETIYCPNLHYYNNNNIIYLNPLLFEIYIGVTYHTNGHRPIQNNQKLNRVFICGTSIDQNKFVGFINNPDIFIATLSGAVSNVFCNENLLTQVKNQMASTKYCACSCDAKDLKFSGTYKGENNELYYDHGLYVFEQKTSTTAKLLSYANNNIITTDTNDKYIVPTTVENEGVTYNLDEISESLYRWKKINIDEFEMPSCYTSLPQYAFESTSSYPKKINLFKATGVISANDYCFNNCVFGDTYMPNIKTAGNYTFRGCTFGKCSLDSLQTAGNYCFASAKLPSYTKLPSLQRAEENCFNNCDTVITLELNNLSFAGYQCFFEMNLVKCIYAPNLSYSHCGNRLYTFLKNPLLEELYIGVLYEGYDFSYIADNNNLKYIYICGTSVDYSKKGTTTTRLDAFIGSNPKLKHFIYNSNLQSYIQSYMFHPTYFNASYHYTIDFDAKDIFSVNSQGNTYKCYINSSNQLTLFRCLNDTVGNNQPGEILDLNISYTDSNSIVHKLSSIHDNAFNYTSIKTSSIIIPSSVNYVGTDAFNNSGNTFTSITHNGSGIIKTNAFKSNTNVNTINLAGEVDTIEADAFYGISNASIKVGNTTSVIAETNAFNTGTNNSLSVYGTLLAQYQALGTWNGIPTSRMSAFTGKYIEASTGNVYFYDYIDSTHIRIISVTGSSSDGTLTIPSTITSGDDTYTITQIMSSAFANYNNLQSLILPATLEQYNFDSSSVPSTLSSYSIDSSNAVYTTDNGVLYSKDKKVLIAYPKAKTGTSYTVDNDCDIISSHAFDGSVYLTSITINQDVYVLDYAFANNTNTLMVTFTSTTDISTFVGNNIFNNVTTYTIDVDDSLVSQYLNNVLVDVDIVSHIQ